MYVGVVGGRPLAIYQWADNNLSLSCSSHLQVFRTGSRGWGVKTLERILEGTFVCESVRPPLYYDPTYVRT